MSYTYTLAQLCAKLNTQEGTYNVEELRIVLSNNYGETLTITKPTDGELAEFPANTSEVDH